VHGLTGMRIPVLVIPALIPALVIPRTHGSSSRTRHPSHPRLVIPAQAGMTS